MFFICMTSSFTSVLSSRPNFERIFATSWVRRWHSVLGFSLKPMATLKMNQKVESTLCCLCASKRASWSSQLLWGKYAHKRSCCVFNGSHQHCCLHSGSCWRCLMIDLTLLLCHYLRLCDSHDSLTEVPSTNVPSASDPVSPPGIAEPVPCLCYTFLTV